MEAAARRLAATQVRVLFHECNVLRVRSRSTGTSSTAPDAASQHCTHATAAEEIMGFPLLGLHAALGTMCIAQLPVGCSVAGDALPAEQPGRRQGPGQGPAAAARQDSRCQVLRAFLSACSPAHFAVANKHNGIGVKGDANHVFAKHKGVHQKFKQCGRHAAGMS